MKKFGKIIMAVGICMLALTGCGSAKLPETIDKTTLSLTDEGKITFYLVDSFDKDYYDVSELTTMAVEDAAAYNEKAQTGEEIPVAVEKVEMLESGTDVKVIYQYNDAESYEGHTEGILFYGTVTEAIESGYDMKTIPMGSVKDGSLVNEAWMKAEAADKHILVTNQKAEIYCPYKVTHISSGVVFNENGSVDTTQAEDLAYILMNK